MRSSNIETCFLFRKNKSGELDGLVCLQVNDSIGAGSESFLYYEDDTSTESKWNGKKYVSSGEVLKFNGQQLVSRSGDMFAHQSSHISRIPTSLVARLYELFASHRGQPA